MGEMETMRQRMKNMASYVDELEKKSVETEEQIEDLNDTIEMQASELSREKRAKEKVEMDLQQLEEEFTVKKNELEVRNSSGNRFVDRARARPTEANLIDKLALDGILCLVVPRGWCRDE